MAPSLWRTNASTACDESPTASVLTAASLHASLAAARMTIRSYRTMPGCTDSNSTVNRTGMRNTSFHSRLPALACAQNAQSPPPCESES